MKKYHDLIFAGTFDHLHIGHKKMIDRAFGMAKKVSLGITTDKMCKDKPLSRVIEKMEDRRSKLEEYLIKKKYFARAKIFILNDIYGSSITDKSFDSILVTKSTEKNAKKVNRVRKFKGLRELRIVTEEEVRGDDGKIISSERIRAGEIDREGRNFQFPISNFQKEKLILPEYLREELRKPLGKVFKNTEEAFDYINTMKRTMVVAVGDIISQSLKEVGIIPDVSVIDYRSRRQEIKSVNSLKLSTTKYINEPSTINNQAVEALYQALSNFIQTKKKQTVVIVGEEDLLTLPAILLAPLNSFVLYGQWTLGIVMVEVTEEKKVEVKKILNKFV